MSIQFIEEDRDNAEILISKLYPLKSISIAGQFAMREINEEHVNTLMLSNPQEWPSILITRTSKGYVYYDGQHRIEAASRLALPAIRTDCRTFTSENDLIEATFRANLQHGMQATQEYRSDYAYWLHITYEDLTQMEIADRAGIKQSTVSKAIARREKRLNDAMGEEDNEQEERVQTSRKFIKTARKFYQLASKEDYAELTQELHDLAKKPEDRDTLAFVGQLLLDASKPAMIRVGG